MSLEDDLTVAMIDNYNRTREAVGYTANRHYQAVRRKGGLARAKDMLKPRTKEQRSGLDRLLEANRPDLSVEALVTEPRFRALFSEAELSEAQARLGSFAHEVAAYQAEKINLYPDELPPGTYPEGAKKTVRVNKYERNPQARSKCIEHYGTSCSVCGFSFAVTYGQLGSRFIHVHHLRPLAITNGEYELDPIADLRPVCPNCHAMLHRPEQLLSITELQLILKRQQLQ